MNAELAKAHAYSTTEQKGVITWLGRRNDAAHGNYDAYDHKDVRVAMDAIEVFMTRFPA